MWPSAFLQYFHVIVERIPGSGYASRSGVLCRKLVNCVLFLEGLKNGRDRAASVHKQYWPRSETWSYRKSENLMIISKTRKNYESASERNDTLTTRYSYTGLKSRETDIGWILLRPFKNVKSPFERSERFASFLRVKILTLNTYKPHPVLRISATTEDICQRL